MKNKWIPEVDACYFFNLNRALEVVPTMLQQQRLTSSFLGAKLGTFKRPPSTLLAPYHVPRAWPALT